MSDLASSFGRTRTAVLVADDERRCVEATTGACRLLGVSRNQLLARPIDDWVVADDRAHARPAAESAVIEFTATAHVVPGQTPSDARRSGRRPLEDADVGSRARSDTARGARQSAQSGDNGAAPGHAKGVRLPSVKGFAVSAEEPGSGAPRVSVRGEIDKAIVDVVRREAHRQIELHGPRLVLDLVRTSFMDSSGLHMIEALRRRTSEQGGALVLLVATYGVRRLLGIAPPSSDVLVVVARPQRDAAVRNQRLSPRGRRTVPV